MARVYKDLFPNVYAFPQLRRSFYAASKRKGNRDSIAKFSINLEANLHNLSKALKNGEYTFGPYRAFYVTEPKKRLIESACFPDRVVHHSIHHLLEQMYDPIFYEHSYACRSGRGHHAAMVKLHGWIKGAPHRYLLKCDIRKFFPSIDRAILVQLLGNRIKDEPFMACLTKLILTAPGTGIPIGNLTSQLFANLYLNELDQFVKRKLRIRHYIRYMDDFILIVDSREEAQLLRNEIQSFLKEKLNLALSPQKVMIGPCKEGVAFLGFHLKPELIRLRGSLFRRMKRRIAASEYRQRKGLGTRKNPDPLLSTLRSYAGHVRYCSNHRFLQEYLLEKAILVQGGADPP
jgi:retron-type reverse transcriptase